MACASLPPCSVVLYCVVSQVHFIVFVFLSCLLCFIVLTEWEALNLELIINSTAVSNVPDKDELDRTG